jgi:DNA repair photolyase
MNTIRRKTLLYKSGLGKDFYAVNHVLGCSHGCRYPCYAFSMAKTHGRVKDYREWCRPRLVENALDLLDRELARRKNAVQRVHLCLTTDPFMVGYPEVEGLSLEIIKRLNASGIACSVLTKGILPEVLASPGTFSRENVYGISLVSLDERFGRLWEPGASPYAARISALRYLHAQGCLTRVHMEPYPTPNILAQSLMPLLEAVSFADSLFFSRWNYNALISRYETHREFYEDQAGCVERFCRSHGIAYE